MASNNAYANTETNSSGRRILSYRQDINKGGGYARQYPMSGIVKHLDYITFDVYEMSYTYNGLSWKATRNAFSWYTNDTNMDANFNNFNSIATLFYPEGVSIWLSELDRSFCLNIQPRTVGLQIYDFMDVRASQNIRAGGFSPTTEELKVMNMTQRIANDPQGVTIWQAYTKSDTQIIGNNYASYSDFITKLRQWDKYLFERVIRREDPYVYPLFLVNYITWHVKDTMRVSKTYTNSTWNTSKTWYIKVTFAALSTSYDNANGNVVNYVTMIQKHKVLYIRVLLKSL